MSARLLWGSLIMKKMIVFALGLKTGSSVVIMTLKKIVIKVEEYSGTSL